MSEVEFELKTPIEVHTMSGGREERASGKLISASPALFDEQSAVKTYFWKAIGKMNSESTASAEEVEKAKKEVEEESKGMDAESVLIILYGNLTPADVKNCFSSFKSMLAKGCMAIDDVKVDSAVVNKLYPDDLEKLLGLYIANFTKFGKTSQN